MENGGAAVRTLDYLQDKLAGRVREVLANKVVVVEPQPDGLADHQIVLPRDAPSNLAS